jgi:hypothetical protein
MRFTSFRASKRRWCRRRRRATAKELHCPSGCGIDAGCSVTIAKVVRIAEVIGKIVRSSGQPCLAASTLRKSSHKKPSTAGAFTKGSAGRGWDKVAYNALLSALIIILSLCRLDSGHAGEALAGDFIPENKSRIYRALHPAASVDSAIVTFHFGDKVFRVPRNYLLGGSDVARPNEPGFFSMQVLLPDLNPRIVENDAKFRVLGFGDKIHVTVHYRMTLPNPQETLHRYISLDGIYSDPQRIRDGFVHYHLGKGASQEDLYTVGEAKETSIATCNADNDVAAPEKGCTVTEQLLEDLAISYFFGKEHIMEWPDFRAKLRNKILSFQDH